MTASTMVLSRAACAGLTLRCVAVALLIFVQAALGQSFAQEPYGIGSGRVAGSVQKTVVETQGPSVVRSGTMFDPTLGGPRFERDIGKQLDARDVSSWRLKSYTSAEEEARKASPTYGQAPPLGTTFIFEKSADDYRLASARDAQGSLAGAATAALVLLAIGGVIGLAHVNASRLALLRDTTMRGARSLAQQAHKPISAIMALLVIVTLFSNLFGVFTLMTGEAEPQRIVRSHRR
jgi:hypothetical protein